MQREDFDVESGTYLTGTVPLLIDGQTPADLTPYDFQLQVRSTDGTLIDLGNLELDGANLRWSIDADTVAIMTYGANQLYRILVREIATGAYAPLKGGSITKLGVNWAWQ